MRKYIKLKKPGLRNIKTVIAVFCCILIGELIGRNPLLSTVAALLTIENNMDKTIQSGTNRIFATIFGGVIGTIIMCFIYVINGKYANLILVPLGIFVIIYICSKIIKRPEFITIACVAFLSVNFVSTTDNLNLMYAINRTCDTLIGVIVGMIVNLYNPRKNR